MLKKLDEYFNNTSPEQIKKDWEETEVYDNVNSPLAEDFINSLVTKTATKWKERASKDRKNRKLIEKYQQRILNKLEGEEDLI